MEKKLLILIIAIISSDLAYAGISYLSNSNGWFLMYTWSVLPVILWITNLVIAIRTILKKSVSKWVFGFVNYLSIVLALMLTYPVYIDILEEGYQNFDNYWLTLLFLIVIPLTISAIAIRIRWQSNKMEHNRVPS